ncbi:extensin-like [Iris pallida]|uniref:Extensin-like n=1 Tax=Iris pallida TaxID=29817 RepID=A0AAX6DGR2_IRIPA|nr:extensin-like [Iris pallida]
MVQEGGRIGGGCAGRWRMGVGCRGGWGPLAGWCGGISVVVGMLIVTLARGWRWRDSEWARSVWCCWKTLQERRLQYGVLGLGSFAMCNIGESPI